MQEAQTAYSETKDVILRATTDYQLQKLEEMKQNLPRYIKQRKRKFAQELEDFLDKNGMDGQFMPTPDKIPMYEVMETLFKPIIKVSGAVSPNYSADEMSLAFDFYVDCCKKLNEVSAYTPKIEDFCRMLNISKNMFGRYQRNSTDENMRDLCDKIQDYCVAKTADGAFSGRLEKTYAIFHQKASNNQRDNEPVQNNLLIQNNTIMSDAEYLELAKKLKNDA